MKKFITGLLNKKIFIKNLGKSQRYTGFTLAEVLITLTIIGVIAMTTIPTLIQNYEKLQTNTRLKKIYSEISQAIKLSEIENGKLNLINVADRTQASRQFLKEYLLRNIKHNEVCNYDNSQCWTDAKKMSGKAGGYCSSYSNVGDYAVSAITASGYSIWVFVGNSRTEAGICVDIDGKNKGKNQMGRDVFEIYYNALETSALKEGVYPYGLMFKPSLTRTDMRAGTDSRACIENLDTAYSGLTCAGLIALDGWQIKDDYPW